MLSIQSNPHKLDTSCTLFLPNCVGRRVMLLCMWVCTYISLARPTAQNGWVVFDI